MKLIKRATHLMTWILFLLFTQYVNAQSSYPNRPVKLIVGFAPGGANDIIGRLIAKELSAVWSQPVVVENRAGANHH